MKNKVINLFNKPTIVQNQGVKYSQLLEKFIAPFMKKLELEAEFVEDIFDIAIIAWNSGNLKNLMPQKEFEQYMKMCEQRDENFDLLKKMIDHKATHFKDYTNFIVDFELEETIEDPILHITTQEQDAYLAAMLQADEEDDLSDEYEEKYIDRKAIVLKPTQAFIDWHTNLDLDDLEFAKEARTYLINEDIDDVEEWLRKKYDKLFMFELNSFHENKKEWPQKRNYKMFRLWYDIDISHLVYDFELKPVSKSN